MERKNISFEQLSDIMAFRVLVESVEDCYRVLGVMHTQFKMVPGAFKDFVSTPKDNGYQSLHTIVMGPQQRLIEVQIRTKEMHHIAEYGVAAHWSYKQDRGYKTDGKQYKWIRELLDILEHASDSEEFLENTKLEMYYDQVFCFTPKGELIALPRGATTIDFAYAVHSLVGHHCSGAKVNGRIVPLRTQLNNGDQVEIITSKTHVPSPTWESFVITGKAKTEIKRFVRAQKRREYIKLGKNLLARSLKESGHKIQTRHLKPALEYLHKRSVDDLYMAIGEGGITIPEVLKALFPNKKISIKRKSPLRFLAFNRDKANGKAIPIEGLIPGMAVSFAECCHPIPGDMIVGVKSPGKGLVIHTSDCEMLSNYANTPERLVDVSWGKDSSKSGYIGRIKAVLVHESGSLASLTETIAQHMGNINNLRIVDRSENFFSILVDIQVRGVTHLSSIITSLRANPSIHSVERSKK
jgi:GTP pyrophosphokinase